MLLVHFEGVSKRYVLGQRQNAREAVTAAAMRVLGRGRQPAQDLWALRDVSFSVEQGEALGIVGRNGSGKSTILKILAGITSPTIGVSRTRGRVAALLEVGTGFHPELSGRENIYLNGAILGMSRFDITRRFEEIVDFSGVERFLDTPVKRYSSGMYLRLAFAVAAHLEPDVLVVDEILAVGDAEFQRKCIGRMQEAEQEGRTLIFVSHDLETLAKVCRRSLWLESGAVRQSGSTSGIVRDYLAGGLPARARVSEVLTSAAVSVYGVAVQAVDDPDRPVLRGEPLRIEVDFEVTEQIPGLDLAVLVTTRGGVRILDEVLSDTGEMRFPVGRYQAVLVVPPVLNVGDFSVGVWFGTQHEEFISEPAAASFTVHGSDLQRAERVVVLNLPFTVHRRQGSS
ncbi:MAG TPA: polysaccharide ABC transporter ATP-binding protein [Microlunatus sp.]|nr:polysaccharide ABC transporter ATP-binding protein [Microlunatus sp.]